MSIVRVGLAETEKFAEGYDLIFGKKEQKSETEQTQAQQQSQTQQQPQQSSAK